MMGFRATILCPMIDAPTMNKEWEGYREQD